MLILLLSPLASAQRVYPWGTIRAAQTSSGIGLHVHLDPAGMSFPEAVLYLAIPADKDADVRIPAKPSMSLIPATMRSSVRYVRRTDSSALDVEVQQLPQRFSSAGLPLARVVGYEWYRGVRLAKIGICPFGDRIASGSMATDIQLELRFRDRSVSAPVRRNTNDTSLVSELVANPESLPNITTTSLEWQDTTGTWIPWNGRAIRMNVVTDGIYRLTYARLVAIDPGISMIDPRTFRMFEHGEEIPLFVSGEDDGIFDPSDFVEFYAHRNYGRNDYKLLPTAASEPWEYLDAFTDTSIYWLTWGDDPGLRMETNAAIPASPDTLDSFTQLVHLEENTFVQYAGNDLVTQQDPRWTAGDLWGWGWLIVNGSTPATFQQTFQAADIDARDTVTVIRAKLGSWGTTGAIPSHRIRLRINSSDTAARADFSPYQVQVMQGSLSTSLLTSGTNTAVIHSLPTAASINQMIVDWIDIEYPRLLKAVNDSLFAAFPRLASRTPRTVRITNLTTSTPVIYRTGRSPQRVTNYAITGTAPRTVTFADTVGPEDRFVIVDSAKIRTPLSMTLKTFANLRNPTRQADYILVTDDEFLPQATGYAATIASAYELTTAVVRMKDIFDEFGFGYPRPEAIRNFLKAASGWRSPMPLYVCLVGEASWDFKNQISVPNPALRPVNIVPAFGYPVSDPWLAVLDDSSVTPQYCIGRVPASDPAEFQRFIDKVTTYLAQKNDDWNKRTIFFAGGDPSTPGQTESFRAVSDQIISGSVRSHPFGGVAVSFYKTANPRSDFGPYTADEVRRTLDNGALFINYIGHSGTQTWDNGIGDPARLANARGRFPLISDFGCSTARFAEPDIRAFGELFTVGELGSAIGYVGNSSLGFTSIGTTLPVDFYRQFLNDSVREIGRAHLRAKITRLNASGGAGAYFPPSVNRIMMLTNTLLGDPALRLAVPTRPEFSTSGLAPATIPADPADDTDSLMVVIPYRNTGSYPIDSVDIRITCAVDAVASDSVLRRPLPAFDDTVRIRYGIRDRPGLYTFTVDLNSDGTIDEDDRTNNRSTVHAVVASNAVRLISPSRCFESPSSALEFLNPVQRDPAGDSLECFLDTVATFPRPYHIVAPLDMTTTRISGPALQPGMTYYWRARVKNSARRSSSGSFRISPDSVTRWTPRDSTDWARAIRTGAATVRDSTVTLLDRPYHVRLISSGFNDGGFGSVEINGTGVLPSSFNRGISITLLDSASLRVISSKTYDTYAGSASSTQLASDLALISSGVFVAFAIIDEGSMNLTAAARTAIRQFGSVMIDSVVYPAAYRASWAFLGRRGAPVGRMPEGYLRSGQGKVIIDTTFTRQGTGGSITSPRIGPAGAWISASLRGIVSPDASITGVVLGIRSGGTIDTIGVVPLNGSLDLSAVSARAYPELQLAASLATGCAPEPPVLQGWSVVAVPPAELALNYQSVHLDADTLLEGTVATLSATLLNAGASPADSITVVITAMDRSGIHPVDTVVVPHLAPGAAVPLVVPYATAGRAGQNVLMLIVDPSRLIPELYRNNDGFATGIFVVRDTLRPGFEVTFDGQVVRDGDYVSAAPEVRISIFDDNPLPYDDPENVVLLFDGRRVALSTVTPDSLFESGTGARKAMVVVRPRFTSGEHSMSLQAIDASGNAADSAASALVFRVEERPSLRNVINFPNPFATETYITFDVTGSRVPDEGRIRIYSVAGRLICEKRVPQSDLRIGFNSIRWDGRDTEGDELANGVYFYKVTVTVDGTVEESIGKLAKVR